MSNGSLIFLIRALLVVAFLKFILVKIKVYRNIFLWVMKRPGSIFPSFQRICEAFQTISIRLRPSLCFFFHSSMLWMTTKKLLTPIFRFFWKFLWQQWSKLSWNSGRYRFLLNLHHKFFVEKKIEINYILSSSTTLFWVAQKKQIKMIFLPKCPHSKFLFSKFVFSKISLLFKFFSTFFFINWFKKIVSHASLHAHEYGLFNWNRAKSIVYYTGGKWAIFTEC